MRDEYIYAEKKVGRYTVKVLQDEYPIDPKEDFDNLGTMVCFHHRYLFGDKHDFTVDSLKKYLEENKKNVLWLPLYLFNHSGITMNTTGFNCPWDSGQVGVIMVEKERVLEEFGKKRISKKLKEKVYDLLRGEVETYDNYLTGNVYGYVIEDQNGSEVDSCWGFFDGLEYCFKEGIEVAEANIKYDIRKHVANVKKWIKNKVPLKNRQPLEV